MIEFDVVWAGAVTGAIYALVGLSYLLIFRATRVLSFAVGGIAGLAAVASATWTGSSALLAAAAAVGLGVAASVMLDTLITRPVQAREVGHFGTVMALAAALFVMIQVTGLVFTQQTVLGEPLLAGSVTVVGHTITRHSVLVVFLSVAATAAIAEWFRRGRRGRLLSAVGDNPDAARRLCLPIATVRVLAVSLAGCVAAAAGVLNVGRAPMTFQTAFSLSLVGFLAVVIGGLASAWGPLCGGILLGMLESVGARLIGAHWRDYLFLLVVLLAFRLRPQGIFAADVSRVRTMSVQPLTAEPERPADVARRLGNRRARFRNGEAAGRRRRTGEAAVAAVALVLVQVLWVGDDPYRLSLLVLTIAYALLGLGIYVPLVLGTRLSVCYNAYFAAGAYTVGLVATKTSMPLATAIPIGILGATVIGAMVSLACRGLSGYHLAVATIGVAHVADRVLIDQDEFTGGSTGVGGIPSLELFGFTLTSFRLAVGGLVVLWLAACALNRLRDSVWGFALRLRRDAPDCGRGLRCVDRIAPDRLGEPRCRGRFAGWNPSRPGEPVHHPRVIRLPRRVHGHLHPDPRWCGIRLGQSDRCGAGRLAQHVEPLWRRVGWARLRDWHSGRLDRRPRRLSGNRLHAVARHPTIGPPACPNGGVVSRTAVALAVNGVSKRYTGVTALSNVSMAVARGEIVGLLGANGAGKSTLLDVIGGEQTPDSGEVQLSGRRLSGPAHSRARRGLARTFQQPHVAVGPDCGGECGSRPCRP